MPSAKVLLGRVVRPHTTLAIELVRKGRRLSTGDPTYRFQIAGVIVFLAGIDKMLSLALELVYLAGKVEWKWLRSPDYIPGVVGCRPGLTAKLYKLRDLGFDLTQLQWLVALRNSYIHECTIYAGYRVGVQWGEAPRVQLRAVGPEISWGQEPMMGIGDSDIRAWSRAIVRDLA